MDAVTFFICVINISYWITHWMLNAHFCDLITYWKSDAHLFQDLMPPIQSILGSLHDYEMKYYPTWIHRPISLKCDISDMYWRKLIIFTHFHIKIPIKESEPFQWANAIPNNVVLSSSGPTEPRDCVVLLVSVETPL